jgi:ATP-dependent DNA ligase
MTTKAYQIQHGRCKHRASFKEAEKWEQGNFFIYEVKEDGIRYFLQIRPNGAKINYLTSRHVSVKTGRFTEETRIPVVTNYPFSADLADTILDGEWVCGKMSSDAQSGKAKGKGHFVYWDVVMFQGDDLRTTPLEYRLRVLAEFTKFYILPPWMVPIQGSTDPQKLLTLVKEADAEGIVRKDLTKPYGEGWTKVKGEITEDCIIFDYEETKSSDWKARNWIGSIKFGQWRRRTIVPHAQFGVAYSRTECPEPGIIRSRHGTHYEFVDVGKCSGMTQEIRARISENRPKFLGEIIEVTAQKRLPSGKLRHPEFSRFRKDKNTWECVWE